MTVCSKAAASATSSRSSTYGAASRKWSRASSASDDDSVWSRSFHCVCRSPRISRRAMRSSSSVTRSRFSTTTRHALRKASATRSWARGTALSMLTVTPWMPSEARRSATGGCAPTDAELNGGALAMASFASWRFTTFWATSPTSHRRKPPTVVAAS